MRAEDLQLDELVSFTEGQFSLHGRRLVLHDLHAFAQFRKDLISMVGLDDARRALIRFGYFWGEADAAAMKRIFQWESVEEWLRAGPRLHSLQGVARETVNTLEFDEAGPRFHMDVTWANSGEAEEHVAEFGQTDHAVCWMLVGYASGYASFCLGRKVYFIEQCCRAKGDAVCTAIGKDVASWGETLTKYLPYFEGDDIQSRIQALSAKIAEQQKELTRQRQRLAQLQGGGKKNPLYHEIHSESFRRVLDLAERVAPYDSCVLITGDSGVGKEVLARHIHRLSPRADGPFVAINCGALPETLLESELFGHKAGAFTGATGDHAGLFEEANKGTILLDEIGDVSPAMQLKLLRVLQEHEVRRVGEARSRKIDVRVLAATNRNLPETIASGKFREDLFYRLAVVEVRVPPLRERREDILPLARVFVQRLARKLKKPGLRLDATCLDVLQAYAWPGNVRELENAIERAAVLSRDEVILPEYLPPHIVHSRAAPGATGPAALRTLDQAEQDHISSVLEFTRGNRTRAAEILGISHTTLWRRLRNPPAE